MLPKRQRFSRRSFPKRAGAGIPFLYGSVKKPAGPARAAVVLSKKTVPGAADRNRLRRRVYAILKQLVREDARHGIIVYPNRVALQASFEDLKRELSRVLE